MLTQLPALDPFTILGSASDPWLEGRLAYFAQCNTPEASLRALARAWACSREPLVAPEELVERTLRGQSAAGRAREALGQWPADLAIEAVRGLLWAAGDLAWVVERLDFTSACEHGTWLAEQRAELQACLDLLDEEHGDIEELWLLRAALEGLDHVAELGWELRYAISVLEPGPVASSASVLQHEGWWVAFAGTAGE
jgi:hypothetical protein